MIYSIKDVGDTSDKNSTWGFSNVVFVDFTIYDERFVFLISKVNKSGNSTYGYLTWINQKQ